mmetsp:Transcript_60088/g.130323  ORF Transcript_60088/g.130323 Transcript_60088/m.130323 type:complete len:322 (+) Transcript_60088:210-1175(+)
MRCTKIRAASARSWSCTVISSRCWTATLRRDSSSTNDVFVELRSACCCASAMRFLSPSSNLLRKEASSDARRSSWAGAKLSRPVATFCIRSFRPDLSSWSNCGETSVCIIDMLIDLISARRAFLASRIALSASFCASSARTCISEELAMLKLLKDDDTNSSAVVRLVKIPLSFSSVKVTFSWSLSACARRLAVDCLRCSTWLAITELADVRASISSSCRRNFSVNTCCCLATASLFPCLAAARRCSKAPIWTLSFLKTPRNGGFCSDTGGRPIAPEAPAVESCTVTNAMPCVTWATKRKKDALRAAPGTAAMTCMNLELEQ